MLTLIIIFLVLIGLVAAFYLISWLSFNYGADGRLSYEQFLESYLVNKERWNYHDELFHEALYYDTGEGRCDISMSFVDYIRFIRLISDNEKLASKTKRLKRLDQMHKRMALDEQIAAMTSPKAIQKILDEHNCPELHYVGLDPNYKYEPYKYNMYDVVTVTEQEDYILKNVKVYVKCNDLKYITPWLLLDDYIKDRNEKLGIEEEKNA